MDNGFTKGVIVGGLIAASLGLVMTNDLMSSRGRKKFMKSGRRFLKRSGNVVNDIAGVFR